MVDLSTWLGTESFLEAKSRYDEDGYLIIENVLSIAELTSIRQALAPVSYTHLTLPTKA